MSSPAPPKNGVTVTTAKEDDNNQNGQLLPSFKPGLADRAGIGAFHLINKVIPWYKLPGIFGAFNLAFLRIELRQFNLYDGYASPAAQGTAVSEPLTDPRYIGARNSDGKFNSLELPLMGCAGMRLGRNFPRHLTPKPTEEELMTPNPRMISDRFMARKDGRFIPATTLNLLAAAWIQFQTHDWFNHEQSDEKINIPIPEGGDKWVEEHMKLYRTKPDAALDPSDVKCPGYRNLNTAWWDGSQIYGSSEAVTQTLRTQQPDGKLLLDTHGLVSFLPRDEQGNPLTGFNNNWWIGMELLHTLFALEHNSICDRLKAAHPDMTGDQIFDKARLVNCALMAKIHTVEWTPAILAHPALQIGMNANWWGIVGEKLTKAVGRLSKTSEIISGIPGSGAEQDGTPYSLTEEFVSVYRMHSLMPETIAFFNSVSGTHLSTIPLPSLTFSHAQDPLKCGDVTFADAFYSFGINYPGAITNNNYPSFLRNLHTPDGQIRDLGTVDILRDRERGVPRYCAFRRLLRLSVPTTFEELVGGNNPTLAKELSDAYNGDVNLVDALVGSHSEPMIPGFGFSETAFRIFILMASRRLKSDRFIAGEAWNEKTYTKEGFKWVQDMGMKDVLGRHFPGLKPVLARSGNVFAPWEMLGESKEYGGVETNAPKA
ncbi:heme peroxidase-domain-containing protein [Podospora didyma]|uniref:Heme peroxidase-domain-containing protein n=1 Tax=Podospora didyma TaxID=330526 RepID=A0AAE0K208_9PEZI|nr:heme peroxidase-domain-containing protein [Podospora didyma]